MVEIEIQKQGKGENQKECVSSFAIEEKESLCFRKIKKTFGEP